MVFIFGVCLSSTARLSDVSSRCSLTAGDADALADLSDAHLDRGEFELAQKAAERCIKANPTAGRGPEALLIVAVRVHGPASPLVLCAKQPGQPG